MIVSICKMQEILDSEIIRDCQYDLCEWGVMNNVVIDISWCPNKELSLKQFSLLWKCGFLLLLFCFGIFYLVADTLSGFSLLRVIITFFYIFPDTVKHEDGEEMIAGFLVYSHIWLRGIMSSLEENKEPRKEVSPGESWPSDTSHQRAGLTHRDYVIYSFPFSFSFFKSSDNKHQRRVGGGSAYQRYKAVF